MRIQATVSVEEVAKFGLVAKLWALIERLAEDPNSIPLRVRPIWLVWAYDAEVKNGGHLQYFHNRGVKDIPETLDALREIGAIRHAQLLETCWRTVERNPVGRVKSLEEYSELASERSFDAEDSAYYSLADVTDLLAQQNEEALNEIVEVREV